MRTVAVMQPYFLPYIGYFQLMNLADTFVLYDDVNYINKGWINRNYFAANGNRQLFTLPLDKAGQNKKINEIRIFELSKFKKNFLRGIEMSYKKAPYYSTVNALLHEVVDREETNLSSFLFKSFLVLKKYLGIETEIIASSTKYHNTGLKGEDRIIDICKQENATHYINLSGGIELYSREKFAQACIDIKFIQSGEIFYKQQGNAFIPFLSVVDILMYNTPAEIQPMLMNYKILNK